MQLPGIKVIWHLPCVWEVGSGGWAQLTLHVFLRALSTLVFETAHSLNVDLTTSVRLTGPQAPGLPVCLGSERWDYGGEL